MPSKGYCRGERKHTSPSPPKLPNFMLAPSWEMVEGGRPPLAEGWGMGMGDWAGEGIRWLFPAMGCEGVECAMAGDSS